MEQEIYTIIQYGGWAVVVGIFIIKVLAPLVKHWVSKMNGGNGSLWDKVAKIEGNHLTDVAKRLDRLDSRMDDLSNRVARIEGKLER